MEENEAENEEKNVLVSVYFTESHRDRETRMVGIFSSQLRADIAIADDIADQKSLYPGARVDETNYTVKACTVDRTYHE